MLFISPYCWDDNLMDDNFQGLFKNANLVDIIGLVGVRFKVKQFSIFKPLLTGFMDLKVNTDGIQGAGSFTTDLSILKIKGDIVAVLAVGETPVFLIEGIIHVFDQEILSFKGARPVCCMREK